LEEQRDSSEPKSGIFPDVKAKEERRLEEEELESETEDVVIPEDICRSVAESVYMPPLTSVFSFPLLRLLQ
jgi:hypothetical protein